MTITKQRFWLAYYTKYVYGKPLKYFADESDEANAILSLIKSKTITDYHIGLLETLGISLKEVRMPDSHKTI
ncbi:MAG: hypothetical protein KAJ75_05690 [Alphaproteobacteria bacterium]|nr:hypothetical protein [Alphaproteobacteria bacterium]